MNRFIIITSLFVLLSLSGYAGGTDSLAKYLSAHQAVIGRNADGSLELNDAAVAMISRNMSGRSLFVLGEGGSHYLDLNTELWIALLKYYNQHGLKSAFKEGDRSLAWLDKLYLAGQYSFSDSSRARHAAFMEQVKAAVDSNYPVVGIDFERARNFREAMVQIVQHNNKEGIDMLFSLAPYLRDSSYITLSPKEWQSYYRDISKSFYRDSLKLKPLLGDNYPIFKYLVTNPNTATSTGDRNRPMAENLLQEIAPIDAQASYLLDCGMAHSRPNDK